MANKVILIGRLGQNPEAKTIESGNKVVKFSLATSERFKNKAGEKVEQTTWHNIVIWGNLADIAEKYLNKGDQVYLEGKIQTRSWEQDGQKKYMTEVNVNQLEMLGSKPKEHEAKPEDYKEPVPDVKPGDDILPF